MTGHDRELLTVAHARLAARHPGARAFWWLDLDAVRARAETLREAFAPLHPRMAYALKANGLPALVRVVRESGLHVDAGSLGELELARACGLDAAHRTLSGNGRTPEEADWVAQHGVAMVSADHPGELDLLQAAASRHERIVRVALRDGAFKKIHPVSGRKTGWRFFYPLLGFFPASFKEYVLEPHGINPLRVSLVTSLCAWLLFVGELLSLFFLQRGIFQHFADVFIWGDYLAVVVLPFDSAVRVYQTFTGERYPDGFYEWLPKIFGWR